MNRFLMIMVATGSILIGSLQTLPVSAQTAEEAAMNWHQWRGPDMTGVANGSPPVEWSEEKNVKWKVEIDGAGTSTPVIWQDKVFLLTAINTGEVDPELPAPEDQPDRVFGIKYPNTKFQFVVLCLNRETGEELWRQVATERVPHEGHHGDNDFASASPTTDGRRLYCWFGSAGLFCYDLNGKKLWERDLGPAYIGASLGEGCSPVVHGDRLVIVRDHARQSTIEVLNAEDGETIWMKERDEPNAWATPRVIERGGKTQVITAASNKVKSYDLENGDTIWECSGLTGNVTPCPVVRDDTVFCMSGYEGYSLLALPVTETGDISGSDQILWTRSEGTPYVPSPVLYDNHLYFTQSNNGILTCVDADTGETVIERQRIDGISNMYASPVAADGHVYFIDRDGTTVVIKHATNLEVVATNKLDERFDASPAVAGNQLFLRGEKFSTALRTSSRPVATVALNFRILSAMKADKDTVTAIAKELGLPQRQVEAAVDLLNAGNTIPFIARYRKEATNSLDEISLRAIEDALERATTLAARKTTVLKTIDEQELLTPELKSKIENCHELRTLEAIYLPYKPKRRTRATIAIERGLQPLADLLLAQERMGQPKQTVLKRFVDASKDVPDTKTALQGALDIVAEHWSENAESREWLLEQAMKFGRITSKVKRGKKSADGADKFDQYFDRQEPVSRIPGHRVLAMLRGSAEGVLRVGLDLEGTREVSELKRRSIRNRQFEFHDDLADCMEDCFSRLLLPATESSVLAQLKENADEEAIEVFGKNLHELLMAAPAGPRVTIGIDPGFRTGCKVAVVDGTGQFLANAAIYPTAPRNDAEGAEKSLLALIKKHGVDLIAIGNGTASRETDAFVGTMIKKNQLTVTKVMVSESGASIYSASDLAVKEFPDLDITVRGAISIARRLQDPLAELVKSDPKSIGVGQYQHDVNQKRLRKCLDRVVESCVNNVGVDLNMASAPLLSYVAGIGPKLAENIVDYRNSNGKFLNRKQLTSVAKLGRKAFEQAAGFLRIRNGDHPLDNSAVHPESYPVVSRMAKRLKSDLNNVVGNTAIAAKLEPDEFVDDKFGLPTIKDIISELAKPGRDPRSEFRVVKFDDSVNEIADLKQGMVLEGVITNVTHFGAFVDLGVHQDALIHVSQLANEFVSDPNAVVAVGDVVKVKVLEVDVDRKRISASRKL